MLDVVFSGSLLDLNQLAPATADVVACDALCLDCVVNLALSLYSFPSEC